MVDAGIAVKRNSPAWMDKNGEIVTEEEAFGCKVTHDLLHPEYAIVLDEVGGNTNQKGDGNVGGELMLCERGKTPQKKINTKDKHYTVLAPTTLDGKPLMCCVIFTGVRANAMCETGLDLSVDTVGDPSDDDFFEKNSGKGKRFPGGPSCSVRGIEVPCFCRWSKKGGITTDILTDILKELDHRNLFPRLNDLTPFVLLDGHGSRFGLPFLEYINHPDHKWAICIGVPYGTALWQVGDAAEQNGHFNIMSVKAKRIIIDNKERLMISPTIEPYEVLNIVNQSFSASFGRVDTNKKAIAERGWGPMNRNLMTYPIIRATITKEEKEKEESVDGNIKLPTHKKNDPTDLAIMPTFNPDLAVVPYIADQQILNFGKGTAAWCLDSMVMSHDLMAARERIRKSQIEGQTIKEKLQECKRLTAGNLFKCGSCRIGKTVFDIQKQNITQKRKNEKESANKAIQELQKAIIEADKGRALNLEPH